MSKFAILGTLANIAVTAGVAAPMGVNLTQIKKQNGWDGGNGEYFCESAKGIGTTGYKTCDQTSISTNGYNAISELINKLCYSSYNNEGTKIRSFCIADQKDNDGDGEIDPSYVSLVLQK